MQSIQKHSTGTLSMLPQGLMTSLTSGLILREQQDNTEVIKVIAKLLQRLAGLYQIPNWSEERSVVLAEWVAEYYAFEETESICRVLTTPPPLEDANPNWRLTPDTIRAWMSVELERTAERREREHEKTKVDKEPLPGVDYEAFKKNNPTPPENDFLKRRLAGFLDPKYVEYKEKVLMERMKKQIQESSTPSGEAATPEKQ